MELWGNILEFYPPDDGDGHELGTYDKIRTSNFIIFQSEIDPLNWPWVKFSPCSIVKCFIDVMKDHNLAFLSKQNFSTTVHNIILTLSYNMRYCGKRYLILYKNANSLHFEDFMIISSKLTKCFNNVLKTTCIRKPLSQKVLPLIYVCFAWDTHEKNALEYEMKHLDCEI